MFVLTSVTFASILGAAVFATCDTQEEATASKGASLLVDIFSGRPNPVYQLTDAESKRIVSALDNLSETLESIEVSDSLGFRGFEVASLQLDDKRVTLTVVFDRVAISGQSGTETFIDVGQTVHELLLQFVRQRERNIASAIETSS